MKRNYGLIALGLLSILLVSCNKNNTGNTSNVPTVPSSKDSSSDSGSSAVELTDEELLAKYFNDIGQGSSFTMTYADTTSLASISDYFTNDYVYFSSDDLGYALIKDGTNKRPFSYQLDDNGEVKLGLSQSDSNVASLTSYTYVKYLVDRGFTADDFEVKGGGYYTDNSYLIYAMAGLIGWGSYASYFAGVTFELDDGDTVVEFVLEMVEGYNISERYRSGVIEHIGSTSLAKVESFVSSYQLPTATVAKDALPLLLADDFESSTTATLISGNNTRQAIGTYSLKYTSSKYELNQNYSGYERTMYYEKKTIIEDGVPKDSVGERTYVDHSNEVKSTKSTTLWNTITNSLAVNVVESEMKNIRKNDDGSYIYVGSSYDTLFAAITQFSPHYDLTTLSFKTDGGKIVGLKATTFPYDFLSTGELEVMEYDIDFSNTPSEPTKPVAYSNSTEDKAAIEKAFNFFSDPTSSYKLSVREYSSTLNYSMYYEGIYDKTNSIYYYHEKDKVLGSGFFERENKLYGYTIDSNATAKVIAPSIDGKLSDTTKFNVSSDCFSISNGVIRDRDMGLDNPLDYMLVGESQVSDGYEGSGIKMTLNADGLLSTMTYTSYIINPASGSYQPIYVQYTYTYGDDISVSDSIKNKLSGLDYVIPTNWSEETAVVSAQVQALLNDDSYDIDSVLPYVYREWLTTNWFSDLNQTEKTINIHIYLATDLSNISDDLKAQFYVDYIQALKDKGFVEDSNDAESGTVVFSKEGVPFTVTINTKDYKFSRPIVLTLKE